MSGFSNRGTLMALLAAHAMMAASAPVEAAEPIIPTRRTEKNERAMAKAEEKRRRRAAKRAELTRSGR